MEKVHTSLFLLLTILISSLILTISTNPQTPTFKNQNAKSVKEAEVHAKGEKHQTSIPYPYASEDDDNMVNAVNGALFYGGPAQGYFGYPFPGGFFGFPRGIFGFPRGIFGFPLGFRRGFPGGYGGYPGGNSGGYGGDKPGSGGRNPGFGGKAEVKVKEVNPRH